MTTFSPPKAPSVGGAPVATKPRINETALGDGYSQRSRNGLNHVTHSVSLEWATLTGADADTIEAFLIAQGGDLPFQYAVPPTGATLKWTCGDWTRDPNTELTFRISAKLVEVFDL